MNFAITYGTIPKNLLHHHDIQIDVSLWCDPTLLETQDELRTQCLRKNNYPIKDLKSNECSVCKLASSEPLQEYLIKGHEPGEMKCARQMIILSKLAERWDLERNLTKGHFRGPLYTENGLPLLCQLVDYNIEQLGGTRLALPQQPPPSAATKSPRTPNVAWATTGEVNKSMAAVVFHIGYARGKVSERG